MASQREVNGQSLVYGNAHRLQRPLVTGLIALLWRVQPREVHEWNLAVYLDAEEWVESLMTLGMSRFANGGPLDSKPCNAARAPRQGPSR